MIITYINSNNNTYQSKTTMVKEVKGVIKIINEISKQTIILIENNARLRKLLTDELKAIESNLAKHCSSIRAGLSRYVNNNLYKLIMI